MNSLLSTIIFLAQDAPVAPGPAPEKPGGFDFTFIIVMIIMVIAFYTFIGMPQRKAQEAKAKAIEQMKRGTRVVSAGGIHGKVVRVDAEQGIAVVEVAKNVEMTFNKASLNIYEEPKKDDKKG